MTGELSPREDGHPAPSPAELRASHEDRDRVVDLLRVAAGDGRLTADELDERLGRALTARTYGELAALTADLPVAPYPLAGQLPAQPKDVMVIDCGSSSTRRDGRWLVPHRMRVTIGSGWVTLDLTEAVITQPTLEIEAQVRSGGLRLITKPGIVVDADDVSVRSGRVRVARPPTRARTPHCCTCTSPDRCAVAGWLPARPGAASGRGSPGVHARPRAE